MTRIKNTKRVQTTAILGADSIQILAILEKK